MMKALLAKIAVATLGLTMATAPLAASADSFGGYVHAGGGVSIGVHVGGGYGGYRGWGGYHGPVYGGYRGYYGPRYYGPVYRPVYGPRVVFYDGYYGYAPGGWSGYYWHGGWYHHRRWAGGFYVYF